METSSADMVLRALVVFFLDLFFVTDEHCLAFWHSMEFLLESTVSLLVLVHLRRRWGGNNMRCGCT